MESNEKPLAGDQLAELMKTFGQALGVPSREAAQTMLEQKHFVGDLKEVLERAACYPREQYIPAAGYPDTYTGPKPIREQIEILANRFKLDPTSAFKAMHEAGDRHPLSEGWFASVNWKFLGNNYMKQCWKIFGWIREYSIDPRHPALGMFSANHDGGFKEEQIGFQPTYNLWRLNHNQTDNDPIWIFPAQFGLGRAGQSHRRAVELCKRTKTEYPLSIFEVACMIALHPERLGRSYRDHLDVVAPGSVEVAKPGAFYTDRLDRRKFLFNGSSVVTANKYNRVCHFYSTDGRLSGSLGPVTAWTWDKQIA